MVGGQVLSRESKGNCTSINNFWQPGSDASHIHTHTPLISRIQHLQFARHLVPFSFSPLVLSSYNHTAQLLTEAGQSPHASHPAAQTNQPLLIAVFRKTWDSWRPFWVAWRIHHTWWNQKQILWGKKNKASVPYIWKSGWYAKAPPKISWLSIRFLMRSSSLPCVTFCGQVLYQVLYQAQWVFSQLAWGMLWVQLHVSTDPLNDGWAEQEQWPTFFRPPPAETFLRFLNFPVPAYCL